MTPALFALVDAVLAAHQRDCWRMTAVLGGRSAWKAAMQDVGWWRSLWPLGGGA